MRHISWIIAACAAVQFALIVVCTFPLVFFQINQEVTTFKWHTRKGMFAFVIEIN